jgi:hypothetical protein
LIEVKPGRRKRSRRAGCRFLYARDGIPGLPSANPIFALTVVRTIARSAARSG